MVARRRRGRDEGSVSGSGVHSNWLVGLPIEIRPPGGPSGRRGVFVGRIVGRIAATRMRVVAAA